MNEINEININLDEDVGKESKGASPRKWSKDDTELLTLLYHNHSTRELSAILDRTEVSIRSKGTSLGLKKDKETLSRIFSSRYDDRIEEINKIDIGSIPLDIAFKNKDWLMFHYYDKELSLLEIAEITGVTHKNILYWMKKFSLPRRTGKDVYTERHLKKMSESMMGNTPYNKGLTKHDHPSMMQLSLKNSGKGSSTWNGGVNHTNGYRKIWSENHPLSDARGYVFEHRLVMEKMVGRYLTKEEVVHHRDRVRDNNSPENLFLFPNNSSHHIFHGEQLRNPSITEEEFMEERYK